MGKLTAILVMTLIFIPVTSIAEEKANTSPAIAVSKEARMRLKPIQTIAVFLTGNDSLVTRIAEDAISIYLINMGFTVIDRETLERTVGEQVAKKKKEKAERSVSALEIGQAVNADTILSGTVLVEAGENRSLLMKIASFQVMDVPNGRILLSMLFEPEKGKSFSEIAKGVVDILKQSLK